MKPSSSATATDEMVAILEPQVKDVEVSCDEDCLCQEECPCQELGGCWSECRCSCSDQPLDPSLLSGRPG